MKRGTILLGLALWLGPVLGFGQIVIDSSMDDWGNVPELYTTPGGLAMDSPLGEVESFRAAYDRDYFFLQIVFAEARPFLDASRPEKLKDGVWDDFQYVEIDTNLDGKWDFQTQLTTGLRGGLNNLALLNSNPNGTPKQRVLYPEGHKNYMPLGPRASFGMRGRAVEMRLPREPLKLMKHNDLALRVRLRYRDNHAGSGQWVTEYLPREAWIIFHIGELAEKGAEIGSAAVPTAPRDEAARPLSETEQVRQERPVKQAYALPSLAEEAKETAGPKLLEPGERESRHTAKDLPGSSAPPIPREPEGGPAEGATEETTKGRLPDGWEDGGTPGGAESDAAGDAGKVITDLPEGVSVTTAGGAAIEGEMPEWMKREIARVLAEEDGGTTETIIVKPKGDGAAGPEVGAANAAAAAGEDVEGTTPSLTKGNVAIGEILAELDGTAAVPAAPNVPAVPIMPGADVAAGGGVAQAPGTPVAQETPISLTMPEPGAKGAGSAVPGALGGIDLEAQLEAYESAGDGTAVAPVVTQAVAPVMTPVAPGSVVLEAAPAEPAPPKAAAGGIGGIDLEAQLDAYEAATTGAASATAGDTATTGSTQSAQPARKPRPVITPVLILIPKPTPDVTPTPSPTATATPAPTPEPTATATPEPTPTATPEPTATPRPTPTATPTPEPGMEPLPGLAGGTTVLQAIDAPIAVPGAEPITVDGNFEDWTQAEYVFTVPTQRKIAATNSIAIVDKVSMAASAGFLYVRIDFDQAHREYLPGGARAKELLDSGAYLRLEADGNALWDFEVRLVPKPVAGAQNAGAIPCMVINAAGQTVLLPATDALARADGPLACMDAEGRAVEIRLPRAPLGLNTKRPIFARAMVRFLQAGSPWQTMYYPASDNWFAGDFVK